VEKSFSGSESRGGRRRRRFGLGHGRGAVSVEEGLSHPRSGDEVQYFFILATVAAPERRGPALAVEASMY